MVTLADLLRPLPETSLGLLAVAVERCGQSKAAPAARDLLLRAGLITPAITELEIDNVLHKLASVRPELLPARGSEVERRPVPCLVSSCGSCGNELVDVGCVVGTSITLRSGLLPVEMQQRQCRQCETLHTGCWRVAPNGCLLLACCPSTGDPFQIQPHSAAHARGGGATCVDLEVLRLCSSLVLRLHGSFSGILRVLRDMSGASLSLGLRNELLHAWMLWRLVDLLSADRLSTDLACIGFTVSHHRRQLLLQGLRDVQPILRDYFLDVYSRQHTCDVCSQTSSVGLDVKVGFASALCAHGCSAGGVRPYPLVNLSVSFGCVARPAVRHRFCAAHRGLASAASADAAALPKLCPGEHALRYVEADPVWSHACDACAAPLIQPTPFWTCSSDCDFDLCPACVNDAPAFPGAANDGITSAVPAAPTGAPAGDVDPEDVNPCGIVKVEPPGKFRRHGGVLTAMLGCGAVAAIEMVAGRESATQCTGLLSQVACRRELRFVVYDNACMLSHFIRRRARLRGASRTLQCLGSLKFALDRFHAENHKACRDPSHRLYQPEVEIGQYPELKHLNTAWNESWNSWIDRMVPQVCHMDADVLEIFVLLVADLWNDRIVRPSRSMPPRAPGPLRRDGLLRRVRPRMSLPPHGQASECSQPSGLLRRRAAPDAVVELD